jgi:hypothetical protein
MLLRDGAERRSAVPEWNDTKVTMAQRGGRSLSAQSPCLKTIAKHRGTTLETSEWRFPLNDSDAAGTLGYPPQLAAECPRTTVVTRVRSPLCSAGAKASMDEIFVGFWPPFAPIVNRSRFRVRSPYSDPLPGYSHTASMSAISVALIGSW